MKILIIDNHPNNLEALLALVNGHEVAVLEHEKISEEEAKGFDIIILSGGSHVPTVGGTSHTYDAEIDFIRLTNKPVIGICLGCQLIAKAFGCKLKKLPERAKGVFDINVLGKNVKVFEAHKYCVDKVCDELEVLGESDRGIEMIKHKEKPFYGLQFHPELLPGKTNGKEIFDNILKEIEGDIYARRASKT